jgi:hypothetical protein
VAELDVELVRLALQLEQLLLELVLALLGERQEQEQVQELP